MANNFKTRLLILNRQKLDASGNSLYLNDVEIGSLISGNLIQSGVIIENQINLLSGQIIATGQIAQNNALNLSGNLASTGSILDNKINSESGWADGIFVHRTGNETISGNKLFTGQTSFVVPTLFSYGQYQAHTVANPGAIIDIQGVLSATNPSGILVRRNATQYIHMHASDGSTHMIEGVNGVGNPKVFRIRNYIDITGGPNVLEIANSAFGGVNLVLVTMSGNVILPVGTSYLQAPNVSGFNVSGQNFWSGQVKLSDILYPMSNPSGFITGFSSGIYATIANLASTGQQNYLLTIGGDTNISGNINSSGRRAWDDATNLSGNLASTGSILDSKMNSLSGTSALAYLPYLYGTGVKTFVRFVGHPNTSYIFGTDYILVATGNASTATGILPASASGQIYTVLNAGTSRYMISGIVGPDVNPFVEPFDSLSFISTGVNGWQYLTRTGFAFYAPLVANLASTGQQNYLITIGGNTNLSGNLNASGRRAWDDATNLSGNLFSTGALLASVSGGLEGRIFATGQAADSYTDNRVAATGQAAWTASNNNGINLSGNLNASGRRAWDDATNLSGALTQTGTLLINQINSAIAGAANAVFTTGTQTISGQKTFLGTTYIANLIVTGTQTIVNTQEFDVGSNFIILNATGGARDAGIFVSTGFTGGNSTGALIGFDVPSNTWRFGINAQNADLLLLPRIASGEAVDALDTRLIQSGFNIYVTLNAISGNLILSGQIAQNNAINLSGNINSSGRRAWDDATNISGNLNASGRRAWDDATNLSGNLNASGRRAWDDATNLSGRLFTTGANLSAVSVTGSSIIQSPIFTGLNGSLVIQSGNFVLFSGATLRNYDDGINLSGRLTATGGLLVSNDINLSGSINASGRRAWDDATNISGALNASGRRAWDDATNLSGNLFLTGALLVVGSQNNVKTTGDQSITGTKIFNSITVFPNNGWTTSGLSDSTRMYACYQRTYFNLVGSGEILCGFDGAPLSGLNKCYKVIANNGAGSNVSFFIGKGDGSNTIEMVTGTARTGTFDPVLYMSGNTPRLKAISSLTTQVYIEEYTQTIPSLLEMNSKLFDGLSSSFYSGLILGGDTNISGNLNSSGRRAWDDATNISGNLNASGRRAWDDATNLSGNLNASGRRAWDDATNLSGGLFTTGSTLIARDLATSGELSTRLFNTGANLSAIKVTGSSIIQVANFTGFGSTIITISGGFVLVSGLTSLSDAINLSGNLNASGRRAWDDATNLSGNLNASGRRAWDDTTNLSGNLNSSGRRAWDDATNISGNLFNTGSTLNNKINSTSGWADGIFVHRTGNETINGVKTFRDGQIFVSGWTTTGTISNEIARMYACYQKSYPALTTSISGYNLLGFDNLNITGFNKSYKVIARGKEGLNIATSFFIGKSSGPDSIFTMVTGHNPTGIFDVQLYMSGNYPTIKSTSASTAQVYIEEYDGIFPTLLEMDSKLFDGQPSSYYSGKLFTTGANLSAVFVTGSNILQTPNFSGIGGTLILVSGNFVLISGSSSSANGITQAQLDAVSGWTNTFFVHRTGAETISGDKTFSGNNYFMSGNVGFNTVAPVALVDISGVAKAANVVSAAFNGAQQAGTRNRIINGDMRIDQRNPTGAYITTVGAIGYVIDRWLFFKAATGAFTGQQTPVSPPSGFGYSVKYTNGNAISTGQLVAEQALFAQRIEESNIWDLGYGTSGAQPTTLSFWVKAGATGIFGGSLRNKNIAGATFISCPYTYQINSTNTWEYKTVTIPGPTSGNWGYGTSGALNVIFSLGCGTGAKAPSFVWSSGNFVDAIGTTLYPISTDNGNISFGGIQLERGTQATPFEYRTYSESLKDCERYCEVIGNQDGDGFTAFGAGMGNSTTQANVSLSYRTLKRAKPTIAFSNASDFGVLAGAGSVIACTSLSASNIGKASAMIQATTAGSLTQGDGAVLVANSTTNSQITIDAEL